MASCDDQLGWLFLSDKQYAKARDAFASSHSTYVSLAEKDRPKYLPDVADELEALSLTYAALKQNELALPFAHDAAADFGELAKADPARYLPLRADSVAVEGALYLELKRLPEAATSIASALLLYQLAAQSGPDSHEADIALMTRAQAYLLQQDRRLPEAASFYVQALRMYRGWAQTAPIGDHEPRSDVFVTLLMMKDLLVEGPPEADRKRLCTEIAETYRVLSISQADLKAYALDTTCPLSP